jgi:hypothetical protein
MQFFGDRIRLSGGKLDRRIGDANDPKATTRIDALCCGMIGLGILGVIYGDFALVWQPMASWSPGRMPLAYCAAVLMLVGGFGRFGLYVFHLGIMMLTIRITAPLRIAALPPVNLLIVDAIALARWR